MSYRSLKTGVLMSLGALLLMSASGAWAQADFAFGGRMLSLQMSQEVPGILFAAGQLDLAKEKKALKARPHEGITDAEIDALSFIMGVRITRAGEGDDVTDFTKFSTAGGASFLTARLRFPGGLPIPKKLFLFSNDGHIAALDTAAKSSAGGAFDVSLERKKEGVVVVLALVVKKWPAGDPKMGG
jgi:hypothetical protein